jgi:hypothetical protein
VAHTIRLNYLACNASSDEDRWGKAEVKLRGIVVKVKVKQSLTGLEGSRRLRLPDFKTIGT